MTINLITVTRNEAAQLEETLRSVDSQTLHPDRHIIVDGLSTDDTPRVLERHARPWREVVGVAPAGVYAAINSGLELADGDIIGLLHGNDRFTTPDELETIHRTFEQHPEADFVFADVRFIRPGDTIDSPAVREYRATDYRREYLLEGFHPPHPTLYLRREALRRLGLYDPSYKICGDYEMWLRIFYQHQMRGIHVPRFMVTMSTGGLSTRWVNRLTTNISERIRALRAHNLPVSPINLIKRFRHS